MRYTRDASISGAFDVREHERERKRQREREREREREDYRGAFINRRSELFEEFQTMKGT